MFFISVTMQEAHQIKLILSRQPWIENDQMGLQEGAKRFESNPELSAAVTNDRFGIGFTSFSNVNSAKAVAVADEGGSPIFPSFFAVKTERLSNLPTPVSLYRKQPCKPGC